jgi:hypothetical protein
MQHLRQSLVFLAAPVLSLALACTPATENPGTDATGGSASSGGGKSGGGSGGTGSGSGGSSGIGGASSGSGGNASSGGTSGSSGSGGASGSGGSSGGGGSGGATPATGGTGGAPDAATPADSAGTGGAGGKDAGGSADGALPPLTECTVPSIDRISNFHSTAEGTTIPMTEDGTLLVKEGNRYVAKEKFLKNEWHVLEIIITKGYNTTPVADLSASKGIWLTYNTTGELWFQMRSKSHWNGGAHWTAPVPSSNGQTVTNFIPFGAANWKERPGLGAPDQSYDSTIKEVQGLMLIGMVPNDITISGMRIDGYEPPCP